MEGVTSLESNSLLLALVCRRLLKWPKKREVSHSMWPAVCMPGPCLVRSVWPVVITCHTPAHFIVHSKCPSTENWLCHTTVQLVWDREADQEASLLQGNTYFHVSWLSISQCSIIYDLYVSSLATVLPTQLLLQTLQFSSDSPNSHFFSR